MYSISDYGVMIADKGRMDPYVKALRVSVKNDSIVLDIGTGTGIFALLACYFGARHVYAIEPNDAIQVGRELAVANGFSKKISFIQGLSSKIALPQKADVIISDMRGVLPFSSHHLPSIVDARERHLASAGILIPLKDTLRVALVDAADLYQSCGSTWENNKYDLDMSVTKRWLRNTPLYNKAYVGGKESIIGEPVTWALLDYQSLESPNVSGEVKWQLEQDATVHGLRVWFDATLADGVGFSNAPDKADLIYGSMFLPFLEPVLLNKNDTVSVKIQANLVGDEYIWRWHTRVYAKENLDEIIIEFKQSSFDGVPLSLAQLQKRAASYKPDLNEDGLCDFEIMRLMQQGIILEDIAHKVIKKFPEQFPDWQHALARVGELSIEYSK